MWRRRPTVPALALLAAACGVSEAADEADEAQIRAGAALYERHCAHCHGAAINPAPGMADLRAFSGDYALFRDTVTGGRDMMPGFVLTEEELAALYAWVKSGGTAEEQ